MSEPAVGTRFGPIRETPPTPVLDDLANPPAEWEQVRIGTDDPGFPNGGLWRFIDPGSRQHLAVKRTGPTFLGGTHVWSLTTDPDDAMWWGREAQFYLSDLASEGWSSGVRPARCWVDDHDGWRDLWLEGVDDIPSSLDVCRRAVTGLAGWQVANADVDHGWLADNWIARHVGRYGLDNDRTLAHPAWPSVIARGVDPALREAVKIRLTDPAEIRRELADFPQLPTHHDFHNGNIGTVAEEVVIIDWAFVGRGPIGHDAGHLALTLEPQGARDLVAAYSDLESAYCDGLVDAGWTGDLAEVRRSMIMSNRIRLGWMIDYLLKTADQASDEQLETASRFLLMLAGHRT